MGATAAVCSLQAGCSSAWEIGSGGTSVLEDVFRGRGGAGEHFDEMDQCEFLAGGLASDDIGQVVDNGRASPSDEIVQGRESGKTSSSEDMRQGGNRESILSLEFSVQCIGRIEVRG